MPAAFGEAAANTLRLYGEGTASGFSEAQLLDKFLTRGDEAAFEALVARHGPMVLAVCRRVLADPHAADDAFQATFLVLVRKARTIRGDDLLGPWLHRVARRVSSRAGRDESRRKAREVSSPEHVDAAPAPESIGPDLRLALHDVLDGLPEKYRAPVVLCYLEGRTHDEAARCLQWPIGSVKGRLSRAREMLRDRLTRRGVVAPSAALLATLAHEASASVPTRLRDATIGAAKGFMHGRAASLAGTSSAAAASLAEEAAKVMTMKKLAAAAAAGLAAIGIVLAGAAAARQGDGGTGAAKPVEAKPAQAVEAPPAEPPAGQAEASTTGERTAEQTADLLRVLYANRVGLKERQQTHANRVDSLRERLRVIRQQQTELEIEEVTRPPGKRSDEEREAFIHRLDGLTRLAEATETNLADFASMLPADDQNLRTLEASILDAEAKLAAARARPGKPNTAHVGDVLVVEVLEALPGRPISGERVVRPDGTIGLGFYGDLPVVGLSRSEIKVKVIEKLRHYLADEALGLVANNERGERVAIAPVNSDRAFVDDAQPESGRRPASTSTSVERKLDEVLRELEALKRANPARPRPPGR